MKDISSETFLGTGQFCSTLVFSGSTAMPASETKWPRKETCDWKNIHFLGFSFRLAGLGKTFQNFFQVYMECLAKNNDII